MTDADIARGETICRSGKHTPAHGEYLGTIEHWALPVYEGSPQQWQDTLRSEQEQQWR